MLSDFLDCACRDSGKYTFSVSCFMLELYQDDLADLLLPPQPKVPTGRQAGSFGTQTRVPKLEIKKDPKGMVSVPGATMIEARLLAHTLQKPRGEILRSLLLWGLRAELWKASLVAWRGLAATCAHADGADL